MKITDKQLEAIELSLPTGIILPRFALGPTKQKTRNMAEIFRRLEAKGIYDKRPLQQKGAFKKVTRDIMPPDGIATFAESLPAGHPLKVLDQHRLSVRTGKSAENLARMTRIADAQAFLASVGAETVCTAVTREKVDPFLFGRPIVGGNKSVLEDAVLRALVDCVEQRGYPPLDETFPGAIFLPANVCGRNDATSNLVRAYNNSVGLLIDMRHKCPYVIFKELDRSSVHWAEKAYETMLKRYEKVLKKFGFKFEHTSQYKDWNAIILCETQGEMETKAALCEKMEKPFRRLIPILMKQSGAIVMARILEYGIEEYEDLLVQAAKSQIPMAEDKPSKSLKYKLRIGYRDLYVGTLINYYILAEYHCKALKHRELPYIVCYPSQTKIYRDIIGIPQESLIEIDPPEEEMP